MTNDQLGHHLLLVAQHWVPFEKLLKDSGAAGEDSCSRIDNLRGAVDQNTIALFHKLRLQRNALVHENILLPDPTWWSQSIMDASEFLRRHICDSRNHHASNAGSTPPRSQFGWRRLRIGVTLLLSASAFYYVWRTTGIGAAVTSGAVVALATWMVLSKRVLQTIFAFMKLSLVLGILILVVVLIVENWNTGRLAP